LVLSLAAHADWSIDPRKRWVTVARKGMGGWSLAAPRPVGEVSTFLSRLIHEAQGGAVALGVDFALGLPRAYAETRREADFPTFLRTVGADFFTVCATLCDITHDRPFYPARGIAGMTRLSQALALGLPSASALSRACDQATQERPAAAPLFWTLGANQVGKAAIAAWKQVIVPALTERTLLRLWPFEGPLRSLLSPGSVALAETYPAEALRHLGIKLGGSKRRHADRCAAAASLKTAMDEQAATPSVSMLQALFDGFGSDSAGEDRFDSVLGVLCLLNVLAGNRPDTAPMDPWINRWEGWILGQTALPLTRIVSAHPGSQTRPKPIVEGRDSSFR
jgi:hypothetical protein